jgi:hypothetical protein
MRLTHDRFEAARRFILRHGRPLERGRFRHAFEGAPAAEVLGALTAYANADGGFGRALEPDLRAPESSALATSMAFQIVRELNEPMRHPMIDAAVAYLVQTYDRALRFWRIVPRSAQTSPHAPWWSEPPDRTDAQMLASWGMNPTAELVGYLHEHAATVPTELLADTTAAVEARLDPPPTTMDMHELLLFVRLVDTPALPGEVRAALTPRVQALAAGTVARDPATWTGYVLKPLTLAPRPGSTGAAAVEPAVIRANLAFDIGQQDADGAWSPPWSWGAGHAGWEEARREWRSVLTLQMLLTLRAYGAIEGPVPAA